MHYTRFISAIMLAGGMALGAPVEDDPGKAATTTPKIPASATASASIQNLHALPPVLRNTEKDDTGIIMLPGPAPKRAPDPPPVNATAKSIPTVTPLPFAEDPDRPVLRRAILAYPPEFGAESALYCQKSIGNWTLADAIELLGEPKHQRPSLNDDGAENGDIFAFADPSSHYRELELDFDRDNGTLRTVFAYPWKLTWLDCRKVWGVRVSAADADKGRVFYSYLDRRLDVLVDPAGKVISIGLY